MALTVKATETKRFQGWISAKLNDPKWVAKMKARSDEADAWLRAQGLLK